MTMKAKTELMKPQTKEQGQHSRLKREGNGFLPVGATGPEAEEVAGLGVILVLSLKREVAAMPSDKTIQASLFIQS